MQRVPMNKRAVLIEEIIPVERITESEARSPASSSEKNGGASTGAGGGMTGGTTGGTAAGTSGGTFLALVSEALRLCAPETNRKAWIGRLATELNMPERTVESWLYGENAPTSENFHALTRVLGLRFHNLVYAPLGLIAFRSDQAELAKDASVVKAALMLASHIEGCMADFRAASGTRENAKNASGRANGK
jgi:hypothetical protein